MKCLLLLSFVVTAFAQGFVQLHLARRAVSPDATNRLTRRQNGARPFEVPTYQHPNMQEYIVNITVGEPGQHLGVTLDTGSADLWIPTSEMCKDTTCDLGSFDPAASSSYKVIAQGGFNISYVGPGDTDAGDWAMDSVVVAGGSAISQQIFGAAFSGADYHGVLGIGYDTNEAEPNPGERGVYNNIIDNLVSQGIIDRKAYSIYLNSLNETTGSIIFGGIDTTKYSGSLVALPFQTSSSGVTVRDFFVTLTSVVFNDATGSSSTLTPPDYAQSVLIDTGATGTLLDASTFSSLALGLGAVDAGNGNYLVPCQYGNTNATISYTFGGQDGVTIVVPVSDLLSIHVANQCLLPIGPPISGVSIIGDSFLRSAYVVLDMDNKMAALAQAVGNRASSSSVVPIPSGTSIPGATTTASARGTQLQGPDASATGSVPRVTLSHSSYPIGTPTFKLGAAATSGIHNGVLRATEVPRKILLGAGLLAIGLAL